MSVMETKKVMSENVYKLFYEVSIKKRSLTMTNMDRHHKRNA